MNNDASYDFDFLFGRWQIENERLPKHFQGFETWEKFKATGEVRSILGGIGNMDDFVPENWRPGFIGMTLRLFNPNTQQWSIYWMSNQTGTLEPPVVGAFKDGVGVFEGDDTLEGRTIRVRFVWSEITANTALWEQEFSDDAGITWEKNWIMRFKRVIE